MGTAENENPLPEGDEPHSYQYEYEDYPEPVEITGYEIVTEPQKRFEDFADSQLIGLARLRFGKRGSIEEMIRPRFGKRSEEMVKRRAGFPLFNVGWTPSTRRGRSTSTISTPACTMNRERMSLMTLQSSTRLGMKSADWKRLRVQGLESELLRTSD